MGKLQTHVDEEFEQYVRDQAERRDVTISEHIRDVLRDYHHQDELDEELSKTNAEQRIEELVSLAREEITDIADWQKKILVRGAVYQIALWELAKHNYSWNDKQRRQALSIGSRRIRQSLASSDVAIDELDEIAENPEKANIESVDTDESESYPWQNVDDDS